MAHNHSFIKSNSAISQKYFFTFILSHAPLHIILRNKGVADKNHAIFGHHTTVPGSIFPFETSAYTHYLRREDTIKFIRWILGREYSTSTMQYDDLEKALSDDG